MKSQQLPIIVVKREGHGSFSSLDDVSYSITKHLLYFFPTRNVLHMIAFQTLRGKAWVERLVISFPL